MSNPWFYFPGHADRLVELTLAKAEEVNNLLDIISTGFDAAYTSVATKIDATSADALFTTPAEVNLAISTTLVTTSSSSVYWYGSKSFTVEAGKSFGVGQRLRISDGTATNLMEGEITSYSGTSLVVGIDYSEGAGTFTSWTITVTGSRGSASLVAFSESYDSASPNNVVGASRFLATGGLSSIDTVLQPKGTGAVLAQRSDSTATGGNKRGANAVDLQTSRAAAANVASGLSSVIVGGASNTTSSQNGVVVGGSGNSATTGTNIFIGGGSSNSASGAYSTISGGANNTLTGQYSAISGGRASDRARKVLMSSGQPMQAWPLGLHREARWSCKQTTDATANQAMVSNGSAASGCNQVTLANNSAYYCKINIVAWRSADTTAKSWTRVALIRRGANAAATVLVFGSISSDAGDASLAACSITLSADTTYGCLKVGVTGLAAVTINFVAEVQAVEVNL